MFVGIEIGGTKLQAGLGDGEGRIDRLERVEACPQAGRVGICGQVADLVWGLLESAGLDRHAVLGTGIGFGGPVDSAAGLTLCSHQVPGWETFPIIQWCEQRLGLPAMLGNDSDLAGLAEAHFGAGRGASPMVYMNVGSGIGGALVVDGKLYGGQGKGALEIGHFRVAPGDPGGPWRTLESLCSGWSLAESARQAAATAPQSLLAQRAAGRPDRISSELLLEAVRNNDMTARSVWSAAIERLGVAIANVITLLHPACFVLGGGVALAGDLLFEPLRAQVARHVFAPFRESYRIVPAQLGEQVVVHGALKLARNHATLKKA